MSHPRHDPPVRARSVPLWRRPLGAHVAVAAAALAVSWGGWVAPAWAGSEMVGATRVAPAVVACGSLKQVDLSEVGGAGSVVHSAKVEARNGVDTCVVQGTLAPAVRFTVTLPEKAWGLRYVQLGCGGLCGRIDLHAAAADGCMPLASGQLALGATDMGHSGDGGRFGLDEAARADFAHRAQHVTALAAKRLMQTYYGRAPGHSYFNGCSDGGREALVMAQRYPKDFDGILAGAPALNFVVQNSLYHAWQVRANRGLKGEPILLADRLPLLHQAVLKACDALDGVSDGLLADPRACRFDPASIQCPDPARKGDPQCLSAAETRVAALLYDGPRDPTSGDRLTVGGPAYGSELAWAGVFVPRKAGEAVFSTKAASDALDVIFEPADRPASLDALRFDRHTFDLLRKRHTLLDATNPDLRAFMQRGGRLILWHGWSDPHISPANTIAYHEALQREMGVGQVYSFERLYLLPGVGHCGGGDGPNQIDLLTPLMNWVERGRAPEAVATQTAAGAPVAMSRPLYPYPAVTRYLGQGDPHVADSFGQGPSVAHEPTPNWVGSDFFKPYTPAAR